MPVYRIAVYPLHPVSDARYVRAAHQLGLTEVEACYTARLFFLEGDFTPMEAERLARELLTDPVTEQFKGGVKALAEKERRIEVTFLPGVTDPVAENLRHAAHLLGVKTLERVATGQSYTIKGNLNGEAMRRLAAEVFCNPLIQRFVVDEGIIPPFVPYQTADATVEIVNLRGADDAKLMAISTERRLSLDLNEMRAIRDYYDEIQREPTDAELEMLAQTWSEHCVHKTFKANITYTGPAHGAAPDSPSTEQQVNGLLKTYLRAATEKVNKPWVYSAFVDNAGIIKFDDRWDIAFKAETHNRPSALEPFGGANTGSGGVIRDVLGVSARPIANTDILCFGMPDMPHEALPEGVLHPRRVADGVIAGIEDYGNKMGIPTVNGAIVYHPGYTANPLVFCGCVGILPHGSHRSKTQPGDLIVVIGGRTGRDGLRGATFSSMEMDTSTATLSGGAVQIGHPIQEKQVQEVVLRARDAGLYNAITDCGAGGLSSAVGEMGAEIGATIQLADVPLKYPGLRPWEIWLSEAQERMVLAVAPDQWEALKAIADSQDVEAVVIGTFEPTGNLTLNYGDKQVGEISMHFLHDGIPTRNMQAVWTPPPAVEVPAKTGKRAYNDDLLQLLAMPTIRSKEDVVRKYDHEVQTGTAVKPLVGVDAAGPGDATVIVPQDTVKAEHIDTLYQTTRGFALSNGICPTYSEYDPYAMAWAAIDEAMRNLVAVGADPDQVAILDNFCWGNTQLPDRLGALVRCSQGCYDAAVAYDVPFISGKDSLNNEYLGDDGQRHAIPGTLLISAVGIVPDVNKTVTMDLKGEGNLLYVIGETRPEFGGSHYHLLHDLKGGTVPQPVPDALNSLRNLHRAIRQGLIQSCHDLSEGGLAVGLAEMCIAGRLGAEITIPEDQAEMLLFAESAGRFVVEVRVKDADAFATLVKNATYIGRVTYKPRLVVRRDGGTSDEDSLIYIKLPELEKAWRGDLAKTALTKTEADTRRETLLVSAVVHPTSVPKVLILHANGTNRDRDAALACQLAGGEPEIVHVNQLLKGERKLLDYHMLVVPGGFSYGDDLGAGVLWALDLRERLADIDRFVAEGRPVLGICNGFQTLVKAGLLPGKEWSGSPERKVTLTYNEQHKFECRWVFMQPNSASPCLFTDGLIDLIHCPIAHGEGQVATSDDATLQRLLNDNLHAVTYVDANGQPAGYPYNPNGSAANIAGLCNPAGNVFGLMPHPENHIFPWQNPQKHRGITGLSGLRLFENGIRRC